MKKVAQPQDKYVLRLPDGMRERLKAAAEANGRSMNAEMIHRLERSFEFDYHVEVVSELDLPKGSPRTPLALGEFIDMRIIEFLTSERLRERLSEAIAKDTETATDTESSDNGKKGGKGP
ncbi:Arc family DNA-binding protein [Sinorhizobium fredii]|nr:Arc family DNA-binding protein [Sinorhizobium fredii]MQW94768.1 Arc family DNA-binding protein [Sinorhizobium fredii]UTY50501.1 Arc family DNA-binding protein [Sinorhizobium fredii]